MLLQHSCHDDDTQSIQTISSNHNNRQLEEQSRARGHDDVLTAPPRDHPSPGTQPPSPLLDLTDVDGQNVSEPRASTKTSDVAFVLNKSVATATVGLELMSDIINTNHRR